MGFIVVFALLLLCACPTTFSKLNPSFSSFGKGNLNNKPSGQASEYSIYSLYTQNSEITNEKEKSLAKEREQLYEAYNMLHSLAQDFHKPFDAPAVIVVGHQTSGKSALIEALMGFQFNQVGGGTKTRRPIALRMQYNPNCLQPLCFLTLENGKEEQRSLADIQV
jgi:ABC-type transport system involved in cytochrome bd biosynthesis fused ATPase/permease subunit